MCAGAMGQGLLNQDTTRRDVHAAADFWGQAGVVYTAQGFTLNPSSVALHGRESLVTHWSSFPGGLGVAICDNAFHGFLSR